MNSAGLERTACVLCWHEDDELLFTKQGFRIVRCRRCGLVYVNPRPTRDTLAELYRGQVISPTAYYIRTENQDTTSFVARLSLLERYRPPGLLLDLGCGPGSFLAVARERGWQTIGLDVNPQSVAHCHQRGLEAICDVFPSRALEGRSFDAIVMNDFIEHLPDPGAALGAAAKLLTRDGVLFIATPDIGSLMARLTGRRWLHLKPNEHLVYYDRRTIGALLGRSGFRIEYLRSIGRVRNLGVALEKMRAFGEIPSAIARRLVPRWLADRVDVSLNLGDEMAVVARTIVARRHA